LRVRGGNTMEVTLSAVGDVILGGDYRVIQAQPYAPLSGEQEFDRLIAEYGYDYPFKNFIDMFKADDITVINLEGVLTNGNTRKSGRPHYLRARAEYATSILAASGVDVACLANNHTLDYSYAGYKATKRALDSAGIGHMGHFEGEDYVINVKKNGLSLKVGFCAMQMPVSRETMQKEIQALRKTCDIVVASFHWANVQQWKANVTTYMRANARAAIKFGADLVLGHHRHLPSGIERYGDKLIVYDLANFITGLKHVGCDESMVFQITWRVDETGYIEEAGFKVIPVKTTASSETFYYETTTGFGKNGMPINEWQPVIATGSEARRIIDYINDNSLKVTVPYYYD
ncbi:MAG: CapA family protein, partial [Clostridia bacterium]|nr:CapA family protein [Clostridia bacterium]